MSKPTIRIHDAETNEVIDREMTDAEYTIYLEEVEREKAEVTKQNELAAKKADVLARLGLTADEVAALLA